MRNAGLSAATAGSATNITMSTTASTAGTTAHQNTALKSFA
jgi:hypothetical protein